MNTSELLGTLIVMVRERLVHVASGWVGSHLRDVAVENSGDTG